MIKSFAGCSSLDWHSWSLNVCLMVDRDLLTFIVSIEKSGVILICLRCLYMLLGLFPLQHLIFFLYTVCLAFRLLCGKSEPTTSAGVGPSKRPCRSRYKGAITKGAGLSHRPLWGQAQARDIHRSRLKLETSVGADQSQRPPWEQAQSNHLSGIMPKTVTSAGAGPYK